MPQLRKMIEEDTEPLTTANGNRYIGVGLVLNSVVKATKIEISALQSSRRDRDIVYARFIFYWLVKKHTDLTLADISKLLGKKRHHSTIIHGIKVVNDSEKYNHDLYKIVLRCKRLLII